MKTTIINNPKFDWVNSQLDDYFIYFVGGFWSQKHYVTGKTACKKIRKILEQALMDRNVHCQTIRYQINHLTGHYSFIIDSPHFIIASVDKIRSYPIFHAKTSKGFYISNSATDLQVSADLMEPNTESVLEFQMAGFVTGSNTLYQGLHQLQGGEFLVYEKKNNKLTIEKHFTYFPEKIFEPSEEDLLEKSGEAIDLTFSKLINSLNGRPVWIPLSGGLDSRLILAKLIEFKYDNINAFTYGIRRLWELKFAQEIAEIAKIRWRFIHYNPHKIRKLYHTAEREEYYKYGSGLCSLPFVSDYFALKFLIEKRMISEDAVIINGQTGDFLTGGHIPAGLEKGGNSIVSFDYLVNLIIEKHFSLWSNLKSVRNLTIIRKKIEESLIQFTGRSMSGDTAAFGYELHEWQERQCKYVVNGQRVYDWFGFDWRLPLWSDELMEFWRQVPLRMKFGQRLHKRYLKQYDPAGLFNLEIKKSNASSLPQILRLSNIIYSVLAKLVNLDRNYFNRSFAKYFGSYSPFYPQQTYLDFLKDSKDHRNIVSYHSRILLDNFRIQI